MAGDYITLGSPIDLRILSHILLQFGVSNKLPRSVTEGIRAVTFLMEDTHTQQITDSMAEHVKSLLSNHMESFGVNIDNIRETVGHVTNATKAITTKMDEITDGFHEITDGFHETTDHLVQATQKLTEKTTEANSRVSSIAAATPITYAAAVHQQTHPDCAALIAKGNTTDRQILIQKDCDATDNALVNLTEKDLVIKANTALKLMGWEGLDKL